MYNVCIEGENWETIYEPLVKTIIDDPITMALYAKENNLLDTPGWKSLKKQARRERSSYDSLSKSDSDHSEHHLSTNTDFKYRKIMVKHADSMNATGTTSGL